MNRFHSNTQATLTASTTDVAQANSAGLNFTSKTHAHALHDSLNFHSRASNLTTLDNLKSDFATSSDINRQTASAPIQSVTDQSVTNCFNLNQPVWGSQADFTGQSAGLLTQTTRQWLNIANAGGSIAQTSFAPTALPQTTLPTIQLVSGTLGADTFTVLPGMQYNVFSGNGNVEFGSGRRDMIDLSGVFSSSVSVTLATATSGILFNPGNGTRVFDAITFSNGKQILFEGIDQIRFANGSLNLSIIPNDPGFNQQSGLHMMGVQNAWRFTRGSTNVLIGIEDTGLGMDAAGNFHPDLRRDKTLYNSNSRDDFFRNVPGLEYGSKAISHGTGVQGIIAAASNNGFGMSGINWNSTVANLDVLDNNPGDLTYAQATQVLINQANSQGQRLVINMSLGGDGPIDPAFEQLVAQNQANALFVIAAGNDGRFGLSNPASLASRYANVVAVGASWETADIYGVPRVPGTRTNYSNYGPGLTLMGPSEVVSTKAAKDTLASAVRFNFFDRVNDLTGQIDLKDVFDGTSAAAPNVTGVASLVWSVNPYLTATQVRSILSQTASDLGAKGYDQVYGNGLVNADAAVRRAMAIGRGAA